jgi:hypothetical protein
MYLSIAVNESRFRLCGESAGLWLGEEFFKSGHDFSRGTA